MRIKDLPPKSLENLRKACEPLGKDVFNQWWYYGDLQSMRKVFQTGNASTAVSEHTDLRGKIFEVLNEIIKDQKGY